MGAEVCLPVADRAQDRTTTTMIALAMNIVDKTRDGTVDGMAVGGAELNYEMQTFSDFCSEFLFRTPTLSWVVTKCRPILLALKGVSPNRPFPALISSSRFSSRVSILPTTSLKDARQKRHLARPAMRQQTQKLKLTFVQDQL